MANTARIFGGMLAMSVMVTGAAQAQSIATPAEFPPTSYSGTQYVDSAGCAFVRVGNGGVVNWVPRVSRNRQQLCGFTPTQVAPWTSGGASNAPVIQFDDPPVVPTVSLAVPDSVEETPAPQPRTIAQVCEGQTGVQAGFVTADGRPLDCGPGEAVAAPVSAPEATPVATPAPAAAPVPVIAPVPVPVVIPEPQVAEVPVTPRVTLAQACEGRFGVQEGFVTSDGTPVDCGPAPVVAPAPVIVPVSAPVEMPAPEPEPALRQVTRAEICAEIVATGKRIIDSATGAPVECPPAPVVVASVAVNGAPSGPSAPLAGAAPAAPTLLAPVRTTTVPRATETAAPRRTASAFKLPFSAPEIPASNPAPASVAGEVIRPPAGYERVWKDGRINPHRGVRRISVEEAQAMGLM